MAGFNDLPNEIILGVWLHVLAPEDIASFALVSKRVFELGTSFLEEDRRLRSKYTIVKNNRSYIDPILAELLNDILTNPRIAFYVRHLYVYECCKLWNIPFVNIDDIDGLENIPYPEPRMNLFRNEIRGADYLLPSEIDAWIQHLEGGYQEPLLASLLNLLPGLCTLELATPHSVADLCPVLHRIIKKSSTGSFPRLKDIYLSGDSCYEDKGMPLVELFFLLPSVERISCYRFFEIRPEGGIPDCIIAPRSSFITELNFDSCDDITQGLSSLLEGIKALKKFTYVLSVAVIDASWLHSTLLQHCQYSLEYLKLASFDVFCENASFTGTLGSLHLFENLKEIDLEFSLMVDPGADREFDIPDSLPDSIEAIHILGRSEEAEQQSLFIRRLVNAKRTELLDLKRLSHRAFDVTECGREFIVANTDLCEQCGWHDIVEKPE